jgi:hypothetical protein
MVSTSSHTDRETAMKYVTQWSVLSLLCLLGTQQGQAQPTVCAGEQGCVTEEPTAAAIQPSSAATKLAILAVPERCPGAAVDVTAASPDQRQLACSAAGQALELLGQCGIALRRPLRVQIMREVRHPFSRDAIFGFFDTKHERVFVTEEANVAALVKGTPYAGLPQRAFYRSLIVHEVVHGVMHQNLKRQPTSHAAHEYPAYALQIASLPPEVRGKFLQSVPNRAKPGEFIFNDPILSFDPFFFAANAFEHLHASGDGSAKLTALLGGEVAFIPTLPP